MGQIVAEMTISDCLKYDRIPEYYTGVENNTCVVIGCFRDEEKSDLCALMIVVPDIFDPKYATIRYVWVDVNTDRDKTLKGMIRVMLERMKELGVIRLFYWRDLINGVNPDKLTESLVRMEALKEENTKVFSTGWYVDDIFDSEFSDLKTDKLKDRAGAVKFTEYSPAKRKLLLKKLGVKDSRAHICLATESPYNMFFMEDGCIRAAMTIEQTEEDTFVLNTMLIKKEKFRPLAMRVLIKEMLTEALIGYGPETKIIIRAGSSKELQLAEKILGKPGMDVVSKGYIGGIKHY